MDDSIALDAMGMQCKCRKNVESLQIQNLQFIPAPNGIWRADQGR